MPFTSPPSPHSLMLASRPLQRLFVRVSRFMQRRPLLSKALPTAGGFAFGDLLTQHFNQPPGRTMADNYDPKRTLAMAAVGAVLAGPLGLAFLRWLDVVSPAATPLAAKLALEQVLGCAIWQAAYCVVHPPYVATVTGALAGAQQAVGKASQRLIGLSAARRRHVAT